MGSRHAELLALALENDDPFPDNICPGCRQDITGWERWHAHFAGRLDERSEATVRARVRGERGPWPFANGWNREQVVCPWDRDYLAARAYRRRFIAKHREVPA